MMDPNNQPDIDAMAARLQNISSEWGFFSRDFIKLTNLPPVQQHNEITTAINNLVAEIQSLRGEVQQLRIEGQQLRIEGQRLRTDVQNGNHRITGLHMGIEELDVGFNGLRRQLSAMDMNNIIRLTNSKVHGPDTKLQPLYSLSENTPIQNFPQTVGLIQSLSNQELDRILQELQLSMPAIEEEVKKQRLIQASGVTMWELPSQLLKDRIVRPGERTAVLDGPGVVHC